MKKKLLSSVLDVTFLTAGSSAAFAEDEEEIGVHVNMSFVETHQTQLDEWVAEQG